MRIIFYTSVYRLPTTVSHLPIKEKVYISTKSFKELDVWKLPHRFVLEVYEFTKTFPDEEKYGLTSQFRRAAISIPANICEGYKKRSKKDKIRFYNISQGSIEECSYYIILSKDLNYGYSSKLDNLLDKTIWLYKIYSGKYLKGNRNTEE